MSSLRSLPIKFWIGLFFFDATGLSNSLLANELDLLGASDPLNGLQVLALYVGQFIGSLGSIHAWRTLKWKTVRKILPLVFLDVVSNIAYWTALLKAGSGITTVVYTSIVVFSAIFQYVLFGKTLTVSQLVGIAGVTGFVGLAAASQVQNNKSSAGQMLLGVILAAAAAAGFALDFVIANYLLDLGGSGRNSETVDENSVIVVNLDGKDGEAKSSPLVQTAGERYSLNSQGDDDRLTETQLQVIMSLGIVPSLIYVLCYTVPFREELIIQPVNNSEHAKAYSWGYLWMIYVFFIMSNGIHQTGYFHIVGEGPIAAVTTSVNKGLQSAMVFLGSAFVYCKIQHSQCLTVEKVVGAIGVSLSVVWYAVGDMVTKSAREKLGWDTARYSNLD
eukprot:CAMPEP_0114496572 /NCGR_PEP_ID=MMETSP0109-20121206/5844_1 /TAXON_ID=29199 /ORGANISM="Chlorarachnion reptans, Strain CCCM449" /LENGTH=388 /DNA_ID=CAMNT_0001673859 /DNA_START=134 /DNA_END=1297 /DNA_ORIENTATION=-